MHVEPSVVVAGAAVGFLVGLTGMGGGALMTPLLVLVFGVPPLPAISSDLVAALVMRPVGGIVHLRRGRVDMSLVRWLMLGSMPAAFCGVVVLRSITHGTGMGGGIRILLGGALVVGALAVVARATVPRLRGGGRPAPRHTGRPAARRAATVVVGVVGGLLVGMTSVGSGSLMVVLLVWLYPALRFSELVGTDLVQAVPLTASAVLGHLIFGDVRIGISASLIIGSIPAVYVGARLSSRAPDSLMRPVVSLVLLASGLKLLDVSVVYLLLVVLGTAALAVTMRVALRLRTRPGLT